MPKVTAQAINDGWREDALRARANRARENAAMVQFAGLVENWMEGTLPLPILLLGFHHIAMMHGARAGKRTLKAALKGSLEELSNIAPLVFPPDRLGRLPSKKKQTNS